MNTATISNRDARWLAIDAQGLGAPRPTGRVGVRHLRSAIGRVGTIQLDAVNVLERTQFILLFSRLGDYERPLLHAMTGAGGEWLEYWGHAASLLPMTMQPLFRWRMEQHGTVAAHGPRYAAAYEAYRLTSAAYIAAVLAEVRDRGPLAASALSDPRRRDGEWWGRRSHGRVALEWLFTKGELAAWRAPNFERVYDLPDRVIPPDVLAQPTPPVDDAHRALLLSAARSMGVSTLADLADYYRIRQTDAKARVVELVESGQLVEVAVEGWDQRAYCPADARPRAPRRTDATLLSPFDSLIWERRRTKRLFGFDYRIEVYVPEPKRQHGYYVLPLLLGDRLVGRLDLKADRSTSSLRVPSAWIEPGADSRTVAAAAAAELDRLRRWLQLDRTDVGTRGDLAAHLRRAVGAG